MAQMQIGNDLLDIPDETTPEIRQKIVQRHLQRKREESAFASAKQEYGRQPNAVKLLTGFGATMAEPVMGLKQLALETVGKPTDDLREQIATVRGARAGTGWRGDVGEGAAWLLPGGGGTKALMKVLPKAGKVLPAALAGATENAAYEASRGTLEGDPSRGERARSGAMWGAGGATVGSLLPRAVRGAVGGVAKVGREAQQVIGQFKRAGMEAPLTVGQTLGGRAKRFEESLSGVPFTGLPSRYERTLGDWNTAQMTGAARKHLGPIAQNQGAITPDMFPPGHPGFNAMQKGLGELYDALFNKLDPNVTLAQAGNGFPNFAQAAGNLLGEQAQMAQQVMQRLVSKLRGKGMPATQIKEFESELRHLISDSYSTGKYDLGDALSGLKQDFREMYTQRWTPYSKQVLDQTDALYGATRPMVEAGAQQGALLRKGVFTPSQLISRMRAGARPSQLATGNVPGLQAAEAANTVIGSRLPEVGPGTAEKILGSGAVGAVGAIGAGLANPIAGVAAALPLATAQVMASPTVARFVTGRTRPQRLLMSNPAFRRAVNALAREHGMSADVAAATLRQLMSEKQDATGQQR